MKWWVERHNEGSYFIYCEAEMTRPYKRTVRAGYRLPACYYRGDVAPAIGWLKREMTIASGGEL